MKHSNKYKKQYADGFRVLTTIWNKYVPTKSYFGLSRDTVRAKLDALLEHMADSKRGYSADMLTREQIIVLLLDWRLSMCRRLWGVLVLFEMSLRHSP